MSNIKKKYYAGEWYREFKTVISCKECGVVYHPPKGSRAAHSGMCYEHRYIWYKVVRKIINEKNRIRFSKLTPEEKKILYEKAKEWTKKNPEKRRAYARKCAHKARFNENTLTRKFKYMYGEW